MNRPVNRRGVLALVGGAVLAPGLGRAQDFAAFAERCRRLSGFPILSQPLLVAVYRALGEDSDDETLITALYTGVVPERHEDGSVKRVAYPDALMHAAIEDWANVPSFCGGLPGFWALPPEVV